MYMCICMCVRIHTCVHKYKCVCAICIKQAGDLFICSQYCLKQTDQACPKKRP